jgi:redox-sensitive bicupin YhaK (pirin superfamily)
MTSSIRNFVLPGRKALSAGLSIVKIHPSLIGWPLDPFLQIDWFQMKEPFFPPHPHAGFSAVTYMLPESAGGFVNRDSRGDRSLIRPGTIHWTEAARGILHEEVPEVTGVACDGMQIFVDLPARHRHDEPAVYHVEAADVPRLALDGSELRVLAGAAGGVGAAVRPRTDCVLWDLSLAAGGQVTLPVDPDWNLTGLLCRGTLGAGGDVIHQGAAIQFASGSELRIEAMKDAVRLVIFGGRPLNQSVVAGGPFVMSSRAEIEDAERRFHAGLMGTLERSF